MKKILAALVIIAAGGYVVSQTEPFQMENTSPAAPGEDCSVFAFPGALIATDTGYLMRCDPDDSKWKLLDVEAGKFISRYSGSCASGDDAGKECYDDSQCASSTCTFATGFVIAEMYLAQLTSAALQYRYDSTATANAPYPGTADYEMSPQEFAWTVASTGANACADPGCEQLRIGYPTVVVGDNAQPGAAGGTTLNVNGKLALEGVGATTLRTGGFIDGYIDANAYGPGGDWFRLNDGFSTTNIAGKFRNNGTDLCIDWHDPATGPPTTADFSLCRTSGNTLTLDGSGDLVNTSGVSAFEVTRVVIEFGRDDISAADWNNEPILYPAGWTGISTGELDQTDGYALPRDGSVTGFCVFCDFGATPQTAGTFNGKAYVAGTLAWTITSGTVSAAGPVSWCSTQAAGTDAVTAGDAIIVQLAENTGGTGGAEGGECTATIEVTYD